MKFEIEYRLQKYKVIGKFTSWDDFQIHSLVWAEPEDIKFRGLNIISLMGNLKEINDITSLAQYRADILRAEQ